MTALSSTTQSATPMMRQYFEIKKNYPDAILFYRLGDFYEMFYDDAIIASQILDLTLTSRNKNDDNPVPLCGVPYHAGDGYIAKLIEKGKKVVVCEQVEDPKMAKGIVKREVTRIVTPGTVLEEESLKAGQSNFILCLYPVTSTFFGALCDVTTGKLEYLTLTSASQVLDEIARCDIRELIYPEVHRSQKEIQFIINQKPDLYHHAVSDLYFDLDFARDQILTHFKLKSLSTLTLEESSPALRVLGGVFGYLREAKILHDDLLQYPRARHVTDHLLLDESTTAHLELFKTERNRDRVGTLLWHLDECQTPMGSRLLHHFLSAPLKDIAEITQRQDTVAELKNNNTLLEDLLPQLKAIGDLERITNRFILKSATPRDALRLQVGLTVLSQIQTALTKTETALLKKMSAHLPDFSELCAQVQKTIKEDAPLSLKDGGFIADGVHPGLDELRLIERSGKNFILDMEQREKERTGIGSLKIRYNAVFGYFIEITNTHKHKAPADYIRKQTLANAERYITDELKDYEAKVLGASERIKNLEQDIFAELVQSISTQATNIKVAATEIALLDVLQAFAVTAKRFHYTRPVVQENRVLELRGARHPILEHLHRVEAFVPNDVPINADTDTVEMIITGPNMAGKSTLMRMTALIVIMAQMGAFVPCDTAVIGVCDRIFTRVGAHDHLQKGLSTFMVEMVETAKILREATAQSLVLLDEIGRGTSTFDGLSIAWAVAEDLHDRIGARTLFATHYHELCDLADQRTGIKNFHMAVKEWNGEIIFLRKLVAGGTNRSYGVAVASMAGLPAAVVKRARAVLKLLEIKDLSFQSDLNANQTPQQLPLFEGTPTPEPAVLTELRAASLDTMTPLDALNFLAKLKEMAS